MKVKAVDMINGSLYKSTLKFTLTMLATVWLSQLFNITDLMVVGSFCGSNCVAAVGATSSLVALIVNLFLGISTGAGIVVAHFFGKGDNKGMEEAVHTIIPLAFVIGLILTVVGLFTARNMLMLMGTPADIIDDSTLYLKIYFGGIILRMIYVFSAAILRATGDSKTPLIYLSLGGILNVIFNLFFVLVLNMTVDGVAYGTIISEGVSGVLCLAALMRRTDSARFSISRIKGNLSFYVFKKVLLIGLPAGIQNSMFAISNVLLQSSVNSLGTVVVAGNAAANNLGNFAYVTTNSTSTTAANFMGQNYGAKRYDRMKKLPYVCLIWMATGGIIVSGLIFIFRYPLLGLYITDSPAAIEVGITRLMIVSSTYVLCGAMEIYTGLLRGIGKSFSAMVIALVTICGLRVAWILTVFKLPAFHTVEWLYFIYPVSWIVALVTSFFYYRWVVKKTVALDIFRRSQRNGSDKLYEQIKSEETKAAK